VTSMNAQKGNPAQNQTFYKNSEFKDPNGSVEVEKWIDKLLNYKVVPSQS